MLLLNVIYDKDNWVRLEFLSEKGNKEVRHARMPPYFLVSVEHYREDKETSKYIVGTRNVQKLDRLWMEKKRLVRVEVRKPSDVPKIRDKFNSWYEGDIKFTHNISYDLDLIPGGIYREESGRLIPVFGYPEGLYEAPIPIPKFWAFDIEVLSDRVPDPDKADKPIVSVAISDGETSEVYLWKWKEETCPKRAKCFESEKEMLEAVIDKLLSRPFLVGYNSDLFDIPYIVNRSRRLGVFAPFEVKMRGFKAFNGEEFSWWAPINGFHIDLIHFFSNTSIQNYTFGGAYREYSLDAVAEALLGARKTLSLKERSIEELSLEELAEYNRVDAELTARLFSYENFLPWKVLVILARIAKLSVGEVLRTSISSWIASALMYEHRRKNSLIPNREDLAELKGEIRSESITGKQYKGALVIDPPKGVKFNVVVLDFASLYPTIMIRYNISYETVNPLFPCKNVVEVPEVGHIVCQDVKGIQSEFIKTLRDLRVNKYKKLAKDKSLSDEERRFYDALQMTFKVIINASYGVFGNQGFRFFCPPVAESITAFGRYTLTKTKEFIEKEIGKKVLYGDTDSLFIENPTGEEIERIIKWVKENFGLDIELDKVYHHVLFTGRKKNYIGVREDGKVDVKGMVGKKSDVPPFIRKSFERAVEAIALIKGPEDVEAVAGKVLEILREAEEAIMRGEVEPEDLAFSAMLKDKPENYRARSPHVQAALYLAKRGVAVGPGYVVRYVKGRSGWIPVEYAHKKHLDRQYYKQRLYSVFEQLLDGLGISEKQIRKANLLKWLNS